jgi:hypothetical protein
MKMNVNEFENWVEKKYHDMMIATSFRLSQITQLNLVVDKGMAISRTGFTITFIRKSLTIRICNAYTGKTGKAKCNISDTFSFKKGLAIAWARYCQDNIPKVIERFKVYPKTLRNGDTFYPSENSTERYTFIGRNPFDNKCYIALSNTYQPKKLDFSEVWIESKH